MKTNCTHFPSADDICFVCPIIFDWQPIAVVPHTYSAAVGGFLIGRYDQPSDGSTWITITGPAGTPYPGNPKKFPDRISAELWAADTVRLLSVAPQQEKSMTPDTNEAGNDAPVPSNEPTGNPPGQQPEVETEQQPQQPFKPGADELQQPGPDFADDEPGEDDDEDCDDLDDESTGFDDDDD